MSPDAPAPVIALLDPSRPATPRFVDPGTPVAPADDLALTRGDGCFEATRVVVTAGGAAVDRLDAHLLRLTESARGLDLDLPDHAAWRAAIEAALARWDAPGEAILKLILTRGSELAAPRHTFGVLMLSALPADVVAQRRGIAVVTLDRGTASDLYDGRPWLLGGVKTLSYAVNLAAKREAARRGAQDVVFVSSDGWVLEGPNAAVVMQCGDSLVTTPTGATGILASTVQAAVFERCGEAGLRTQTRLLRPAELLDADSVWMLSSTRGVAPVRTLDGRALRTDDDRTAAICRLAGFPAPEPR